MPFGARALLDLPVTDASHVTVDGGAAVDELEHGVHRIVVRNPAVVEAAAPVGVGA